MGAGEREEEDGGRAEARRALQPPRKVAEVMEFSRRAALLPLGRACWGLGADKGLQQGLWAQEGPRDPSCVLPLGTDRIVPDVLG